MSIDRQFGVHEIPGTEEPAPAVRRETVSAGFELQMRGYVNQIWARIGELEGKIADFESMRTDIAEALKTVTGIDPRKSDPAGLGEFVRRAQRAQAAVNELGAGPPKPSLKKPKPWEAEGVSRRTWNRRHKGA